MAETIILNNRPDFGFLAKVYQEQIEDLTKEMDFVTKVLDGDAEIGYDRVTDILERYQEMLSDKCDHLAELVDLCKATF